MHKKVHRFAAIFSVVLLLEVANPVGVSAAESIPSVHWTPPQINRSIDTTLPSPTGSVTLSCQQEEYGNLKSYSANGQIVRELSYTDIIDGVPNCISFPTVDKNGDVYGTPSGWVGSSYRYGGNLLAYKGNFLKWKYPTGCMTGAVNAVVGADRNIYFVNSSSRLIGLSPEVDPTSGQPKKVLDVAASGHCSVELAPFKDGIALIKDGGWISFYTYSGHRLDTQDSYSPNAKEWINASGQLFFPTLVGSGSTRSIKLSKYDPWAQKVVWTALESSFGQGVDYYRIRPTSDGGVILLVNRYKVVAGAPTTDRVYALAKLNSAGSKVWDRDLPQQDSSGNTSVGTPSVTVDVNGHTVVAQSWQLSATNGWTVPGLSIGVFRTDGSVLYDEVMRGNLDAASGNVYGYRLAYSGANGPISGANTLYIHAECQGSCSGETKLYPVTVPGLGMDYPRGAILNTPVPVPYTSLGDSYSAGEGVLPFEEGTDTETNKCHRSVLAYPRLVSHYTSLSVSLALGSFAACSGARTEHVSPPTSMFTAEAGQVAELNDSTKIVSLTIGGNDIGFSNFGNACYGSSGCYIGSPAYNAAVDSINNELPAKLERVYTNILDRTTVGKAHVYVLDYPQVAPIKTATDPMDNRCAYLFTSGFNQPAWADARAARDIVAKLNAKITSVIGKVRGLKADYFQRLHFIPTNAASSPFAGHTVCSAPGESYFLNIDQFPNGVEFIFHPNDKGQVAYAKLLAAALGG